MAHSSRSDDFYDISWDELDKSKFFFYGTTLFFGVRALLYPPALIKTRMQVDSANTYSSTYDAMKKIVRREGFRGLYGGFWVSSANLVFRQVYFATFELVRKEIGPTSQAYAALGPSYGELTRNLVAGACAQIVFQTITVPLDVVTQRLMVQGLRKYHIDASLATLKSKIGTAAIIQQIWRTSGWLGFFQGYWAAVLQFTPNSAIFWGSYGLFLNPVNQLVYKLLPDNSEGQRHLFNNPKLHQQIVQATAGLCGGVTSVVITNPIDVVRTRLQVSEAKPNGIITEFRLLWKEGGIRAMFKGIGPRTISMAPASILIISVYDLIKGLSLNEKNSCALEQD